MIPRKPISLKRSILLLCGVIVLAACGRDDTATLSDQLDYMIRNLSLIHISEPTRQIH